MLKHGMYFVNFVMVQLHTHPQSTGKDVFVSSTIRGRSSHLIRMTFYCAPADASSEAFGPNEQKTRSSHLRHALFAIFEYTCRHA